MNNSEILVLVGVITSFVIAILFRPKPSDETDKNSIKMGVGYKKLLKLALSMVILGTIGITVAYLYDLNIFMKSSKGFLTFGVLMFLYGIIKRAVFKYDNIT